MTSPEELHARALQLLLRGDTAGGIGDLKEYLAASPDDDEGWVELGTAYAAIDHREDAVRSFGRAVELDGSVAEARLGYGRALVRAGRLDDAAFQLLQAARLAPEDARILRELGVVFYDKRLYDKALTWLARAVAAAPSDARAHYALGLTHEARKDAAGAISAYREAARLDPAFVDAKKTLADALASMGEHAQAIVELEAVLALERSNERVAQNLDVLRRALAEVRAHRLLGKSLDALEASALVQEGQLRRRGGAAAPGAASEEPIRYGGPMVELRMGLAASGAIRTLMLLLLDPERAARTPDDVFRVTAIADDGRQTTSNYATGVSLTFLREALGCTMTQAGELYARLLSSGAVPRGGAAFAVEWGGARVSIASVPGVATKTERHGILVEDLA